MVDFALSEEQEALRQLSRDFARQEIAPAASEFDRNGEFPMEIAKKAHDIGLMNIVFPESCGGLGLGTFEDAIVTEELAWGCMGITLALVINNLGATPVKIAGTEDQQKRFLGPLTEEVGFCSYALTEPEAGSDVANLQSTAVKKGEVYVLNGTKRFITSGGVASFYVVFAYTDRDRGHRGMSAFIVPRDLPGVAVGKKEDMMGQRASNTVEISFDDVEVPEGNLLGAEGDGFKIAMGTFNHSRSPIAAGAVGIAKSAFDAAYQYSRERKTFGKPIWEHQVTQFKLASMARDIDAGRLLCWRAAWMADQKMRNAAECAMAKLFCADAAMRITTDCVQLLGGYGFSREYPVEKCMRDAKVMQIYEGTSEIQHIIIARELMRARG